MDLEVERVPAKIGGNVHSGFKNYFKSLRGGIREVVAKYIEKTERIIFTGHSLGAAAATIAASVRIPEYAEKYKDMKFDLITYGSPRVGDQDFADKVNELPLEYNLRFINNEDIFPTVPGGNYVHVGTEVTYSVFNANKYQIKAVNSDTTKQLLPVDAKNLRDVFSYLSGKDLSNSSGLYAMFQSYFYVNEQLEDKDKQNSEKYYKIANQIKDHLYYCIRESDFMEILSSYKKKKAYKTGEK